MYFLIKFLASKLFPDKVKKPLTFQQRAKNLSLFLTLLALSLAYMPSFWFHVIIVADYYTPWKAFNSPIVKAYHSFLISSLPERPELPAVELLLNETNRESIAKASHGFTVPVVIRGALKDSPALKTVKKEN
jgi:hypothetical protein